MAHLAMRFSGRISLCAVIATMPVFLCGVSYAQQQHPILFPPPSPPTFIQQPNPPRMQSESDKVLGRLNGASKTSSVPAATVGGASVSPWGTRTDRGTLVGGVKVNK